MTQPEQSFTRQSQRNKRKGAGTNAFNGAYTAELFAIGNPATGADTLVIALASGSKIRILSYSVSGSAAGVSTITFSSKGVGASSAISQLISLGVNGFAHEADENGLMETVLSEGVYVTVTGQTVGVRITYILVD